MTLAVLTAVYPAALPFLDDFQRSLEAQDDQDFALYVLDDQLGGVRGHFARFGKRLTILPAHGTPGQIRSQGIRALAADGITAAVFADCDDTVSSNRVSRSRQLLAEQPVIVNELLAFGSGITGTVAMLAPILREGQLLAAEDLVHGNVIGMGNSAARIEILLPHLSLIDPQLVAYDWALFTRVLHAGATARFTATATTCYRQHAGSIVGLQRRDAATLLTSVQRKAQHYHALSDLGPPYPALAAAFSALAAELAGDPQRLAAYADHCARAAARPGAPRPGAWWSDAILPSEACHEAL
jgi:hypothetical protein